MEAKELDVFIQGVIAYFKEVLGEDPEIGTPYLQNTQDKSHLYDYTGIIGLSGSYRGAIYITCEQGILLDIVERFLGIKNPEAQHLRDMAGELANTIAGNVSRVFGNAFHISVPIIMNGTPNYLALPIEIPAYVIPISVRGKKAALVVGMRKNE
ncbi:MAG: chemotaxis protein CheX [Leptospiraceae bacterium]|nr:chemotaxis protein CheX [Leptospiraceae bacterium]MDW8305755.1 chemotaxis protein CheX [Leptospiraceae bacterium]